jgi:hypothetical protein
VDGLAERDDAVSASTAEITSKGPTRPAGSMTAGTAKSTRASLRLRVQQRWRARQYSRVESAATNSVGRMVDR